MLRPTHFTGLIAALLITITITAPAQTTTALQTEAQQFLDQYTERYVELRTTSVLADWQANIEIIPGDDTNANRANEAKEALARFTGAEDNIITARRYLDQRDELTPTQVRQVEAILYKAANNPEIAGDLVKQRIAAETAQNEAQYGFEFMHNGEPITANEIDVLLAESDDLDERLAVWTASKEVGKELKDGLAELVRLRNGTVQALGYDDYFQYQVSDYGMTVDEMLAMTRRFNEELRPLYREIHTWARYTLAERYGEPVPEQLPAHWLPNRWGQDWQPLVEVEGLDLDGALKHKSAEYVNKQGEDFYVSLGYPELPQTYWENSSLYPLSADANHKKNSHASAWHPNLQDDVRCLMSVEPNADWWQTVHHELGHIYYYMAYSNPDVPILLRTGANRAYHEAVGSLLGLASMQQPFLVHVGLIDSEVETDPIKPLLREAMDGVVFIPWSAGVMTEFEQDLYGNPLPKDDYNARWWDLKLQYQGIVPPSPRGEEYCDAATKTHINNDAAQYYDYALSQILLQQLHRHIATEILEQDPHATNYFGSEEAGAFLWSILEVGGDTDWREMLQTKLGSDLSAEAMLAYFEPLYEWLKQENKGRTHTLPQL